MWHTAQWGTGAAPTLPLDDLQEIQPTGGGGGGGSKEMISSVVSTCKSSLWFRFLSSAAPKCPGRVGGHRSRAGRSCTGKVEALVSPGVPARLQREMAMLLQPADVVSQSRLEGLLK